MKKFLSPGNLIVTTGGILAFVGMTAYFTDSVNLSVPTFFYGVPILTALVKDVTRWRYGIKAHLESSLEALKLWDEDNPPQLKEIEEIIKENKNGLRMHFVINAVPVEKWIEKQERLNRFFVQGLESEIIIDDNREEFDLILFY